MPLPTSSRSRDGIFPTTISPMRVPRFIRAVSSGASLLSSITLDDDLLSSGAINHARFQSSETTKHSRSLSPVSSPQSSSHKTTTQGGSQRQKSQRARQWSDEASTLKINDHTRKGCLSQSDHCARPFQRMEPDKSPNRDLPPMILQRRCTEPLSMAARKACMQDLGYFESGRKAVLVKRFSLPVEEDSCASIPPPFERAASDESYSFMPLKMPVRKASVEEIRMGCHPCSNALKQPMRQSSIPSFEHGTTPVNTR
ncbi:unnamed protein product [Cylindrotheca closterium]|uniref:Uncharacterized protein n=1 Tax=Cylindrotheca closterium TaxID=2856 RepID=A0AAD2GBJ3_9STRA|nr:unnamed protein product [Cylindrotheca closterium]